MKQVRVCIEAHSPLVFPQRKPGTQFRESLEYVPGGALFGALGQVLGATGKFKDDQFRDLRCHNAYAVRPANPWGYPLPADPWVRPLPATAQGQKGSNDLNDTLIERLCWEQQRPVALIYAPTDAEGHPWEARRGFYTIPDTNHAQPVKRDPPPQRVVTRVGMNRQRGTAQEGMLFSPLVLNESMTWVHPQPNGTGAQRQASLPTTFIGTMVVPDDFDAQALEHVHWIGGFQTTGHGNVAITVSALEPEPAPVLVARINQMTAACKRQAALYARLGGASFDIPGSIFTINLLADAILLDHGWQPTMVLTGEMLYEATGGVINARLVRSFASYDYTGGWHVLWRRPKETQVVTRKGSLYVFMTDAALTPAQIERLEQMQRMGIGERVQEGYGQIRVCDEFHLACNRNRLSDADHRTAAADPPPGAPTRRPQSASSAAPPAKPSRRDKRRKKR